MAMNLECYFYLKKILRVVANPDEEENNENPDAENLIQKSVKCKNIYYNNIKALRYL
jgi:hypothetical protein